MEEHVLLVYRYYNFPVFYEKEKKILEKVDNKCMHEKKCLSVFISFYSIHDFLVGQFKLVLFDLNSFKTMQHMTSTIYFT